MANLDIDIERIVTRELEPGERLLWSGRPGQGLRLRRADALVIPFSLTWASFFVFWGAAAIKSEASRWAALYGIPFLAAGAYFVFGRFVVDVWKRQGTLYGVTDRRVMVLSGHFSARTTSYALGTLPAVTLTERRNGEGDVVLAATDMSHVAAGGLVGRKESVPPALEFVTNARDVYEIVRGAAWAASSFGSRKRDKAMQIEMKPVGHVRSPRAELTDDDWGAVASVVELVPDLSPESLLGLEDFSHVEVFFIFNRVAESEIEQTARHPRGNKSWPRVGIFAQRGKARPNRLGATICRVVKREGRLVHVLGLDAIDGTPVVDLKPVMTEFLPREKTTQPRWATELMRDYWVTSRSEGA